MKSVLDTLRHATSDQHHQLERLPINARLLQDDVGIAEYRRVLLRLLGFYKPLSERAQAFGTSWAAHLASTIPELTRDLSDLGVRGPELVALPCCDMFPALATPDEALGCGYVVEGSALGGRVIARHLATVFADRRDVPVRFFTGAGDRTAERWRRFCTELEATTRDVDVVCATASGIFAAMAGWLNDD